MHFFSNWMSVKSDALVPFCIFKSNVRETWRVILVSVSWHILYRITAHPRGAFISVGDKASTETNLLLLTTWRGGSLLDWDKRCGSCAVCFAADFTAAAHFNSIKRLIFFLVFRSTLSYHKERNLAKKLIYFPIQKWLKISFTRSSSSDSPRIVPRCS